jgi:broad specificity phosphatase PhoE
MAAARLAAVTTVLLARHGETDWNREQRWQGHADPGLNENGRRQAEELAARLADVELAAVYSSDLARALETAEVIARAKGVDVVADPRLREIDVGEWSGLTTDEIERDFPTGFARHSAGGDGWEQGETHAAMSDRVVAAIARIAADHGSEQVLCVLHGGPIRALLAHADGVALREYRLSNRAPVNGSVARIAVEGGKFRRIH